MSLAELVPLILRISILSIVFALGLSVRRGDLVYVFRRPSLLAMSILAMIVVMPVVAVLLVRTMGLPRPVAIMLVALSLAPVPPILPRKQMKAGGDAAYSIGLLIAAGVVSIFWIPLAIELIQRLAVAPLAVAPLDVARVVAMTVLAPLLAGAAVALAAPGVAAKLGPLLSKVGGVLLLAGLLAIIVSQWKAMGDLIGNGTLLAFVIFIVIGLAVGHLLGGPEPDNRTVLAMATATRHPGVALAIAQLNFPHEKAVTAAVLLFLLTNALVSIPYVTWRKRAGAAGDLAITA